MRIKRYKLLLVFLMMRLFVVGQTTGYHYQANINSVDSSGFYNIVLTPEINSHVKTDYSDLRIVNDSGKWVPHLLQSPSTQFCGMGTIWNLKIIKKENNKSVTDLIIESVSSGTSKLILEIKNTLAERYCTLSGSDDLNSWFIINDSIAIKPKNDEQKKNSSFNIEFPVVSYKYFKIQINNYNKDPLNIINISTPSLLQDMILDKFKYFPPQENPPCRIDQKDSGSRSYIKITQSAKYHFDKISFRISGANYYNRNAALYIPNSSIHSFSNPGELINSVVFSNNSTLEFRLPDLSAKDLYLIINNEDNPPLKIENVKTSKGYLVATAWLEKSNHYKIIMDNDNANKPNYDLKLEDVFPPKSHPIATVNTITPLPQIAVTITPVNKNKTMMWLIIATAVLVLGFFTYKLITDMNKSKT